MREVVKKEVLKLLHARIDYPRVRCMHGSVAHVSFIDVTNTGDYLAWA
jgi:hypothetical protein